MRRTRRTMMTRTTMRMRRTRPWVSAYTTIRGTVGSRTRLDTLSYGVPRLVPKETNM
jgi:hypothetical protein